ncbi:MAG: histidinol dehydrogenase, partial [Actinobacteria bacterium]|nr:histidinol dehydrogenase [Actinomycetota bacterium]
MHAMPYDFLKIQKISGIFEIEDFLNRRTRINSEVLESVSKIIDDIRVSGQEALFKYCSKYDGINATCVDDIKVALSEIEKAKKNIPGRYPELARAIEVALTNLQHYHNVQLEKEPKSWNIEPGRGKKLGQLLMPLERVGLYIPGGRFLYPSSILMAAVPARAAGVKEIAVCSPPGASGKIDSLLLYIFAILGIDEVYSVGGAQAVALFAYGTENIKKVDKIAGPGNIYVTAAKKIVYGDVGIDSLAGPSEVLIIADSAAKPAFIAADLLSQSEHDPDSSSIL